MAVDQYGSYTNNPLIYEAITGNTTDVTGSNTLLPLNTPIIDASINDKFAVINLTGNKLRFVSMDNGTTTPATFGVDSGNYTVIKEGLIWDITIPSDYVCYHVGALDNGILFSNFNDSEKVMLMKNSSLSGTTSTTTSTSYIHTITMNGNPVYYYSNNNDNEFEIDHDNFCFIGGASSSDQNMVTDDGIISATVQNHTVHDGKYSYVSGNQIFVKGDFGNFSPTGDSTKSYNTFTNASIFNSYTISKAWVYGNAILALTNDNKLLAAGDNTNHRLTTGTDDTLITTPVVVQTSSTVNDVVYDKSVSSTATTTSYIVAPETLSEDSNGVLNLEQNATNSSKRLSNTVQLSNEEATETPSTPDPVEGDADSDGDSDSDGGDEDMRYDTGQTKVITVTQDNLDNINQVYTNEATSYEDELEAYLETLAINTTVTKQSLSAESVITAVGNNTNITINGEQIYFKILCTIEEHNQYATRVQVTVGPNVQWGTDSSLATYNNLNLQTSQVVSITKDNVNTQSQVYAASEAIVKQAMLEWLKTNYLLGRVITAEYLTADTIRHYTNDASTIYYRPVYNIPTHTEFNESVNVTVGSNIRYGTAENSLNEEYDPGSQYQYTIPINHSNISTAPTTYGEKVALLQTQLDTYLDSLLSTTITATMLGADTIRQYTIANTDQVIYYRPTYNIPEHSPKDQSVTITVGSEIAWGKTNAIGETYDPGENYVYPITINRSNLANIATLYTDKVNLLQAQLNTYVLNNYTLGKVVTATDLDAETVRSYSSTSTGVTVYYKLSYSIPIHVANNYEVTITVGPNVQYGYTNALGKTCNLNQTYTITLNHDNLANASTLYDEKADLLEALVEQHIAAVILNTVVTDQSSGADTIRTFTATTSGKTVYYRPTWNIPTHTKNDEELTITVGPNIAWGYSNELGKTYVPENATQTIVVNRQNIANVATLYTQKATILQGLLDTQLTAIKLGKVVTQQDLGAEVVRNLTTTKAQETIYYKVEYAIGQHTANDTEVQVTLGPCIDWGYEENEV